MTFAACHSPDEAISRLEEIYADAAGRLREALRAYLTDGTPPDPDSRKAGAFCYPALRLTYLPDKAVPRFDRAYARLSIPGRYSVTITRPDLFRTYLLEQLGSLMRDYHPAVEVGISDEEIPYPYVMEALDGAPPADEASADLTHHFPTTQLSHLGDEIADGTWADYLTDTRPLALFDARRTDFSLHRLRHYTGTPADHVQRFILFTNYQRYVDEFVRWGTQQLNEGQYSALSCPGGLVIEAGDAAEPILGAQGRFQMPAYHLMAKNGGGVTLVNIGVGPSNAKTITDHLAVLRPEAWMMIGHCGGLRPSQIIGDYVLAHAYLRDDHVLDDVLPTEIPIPAIAEVQLALEEAARQVTGESDTELKRRLRTGTVVTTDDRNWELRYSRSALRFNQSRAVAIDMESATIAAQGYRFRVPYGTLLCVSDKPLHGEIKLPGTASSFYARAVSEHIRIGFAAIDLLQKTGVRLHSRKLRSFDEPPFR